MCSDNPSLSILIVLNMLLIVWGITMFSIGFVERFSPENIFTVTNDWMGTTETDADSFFFLMDWSYTLGNRAFLIIILSLISIVIGILGLLIVPWGEDLKNIYLICVGTLMALKFVFLVYFMTRFSRTSFKYQLTVGMTKSFRTYLRYPERFQEGKIYPAYNDAMMNITFAWFKYQSLSQCCGVKGGFKEFELEGIQIPPSCCKLKKQHILPKKQEDYMNFVDCQNKKEYANQRGCDEAVLAALMFNSQLEELSLLLGAVILTACLGVTTFLEI